MEMVYNTAVVWARPMIAVSSRRSCARSESFVACEVAGGAALDKILLNRIVNASNGRVSARDADVELAAAG